MYIERPRSDSNWHSPSAEPAYTATFPWTMSCRFEITLRDGRVLTVHEDNPKGHPRRPMSDEEIDDKFLRQVRPLLDADRAEELLGLLWNLEQETSARAPVRSQ